MMNLEQPMETPSRQQGGGFLEAGGSTVRLALDALLLRDGAFLSMRDSPNPFVRGLIFVVMVALIVSLLSIVGGILFRLTSPDIGAIQAAVWERVRQMPWTEQIPAGERAAVLAQVKGQYDLVWRMVRSFLPGIGNVLAGVILNPIALVVGWLIYGLLAFVFARLLGGRGNLEQTYGATALAVAPRLLGAVHVMPYVDTAGLGTWALICNYLALKNVHQLTPWRAFWAVLLPFVILFLFVAGLGILVAVFVGAIVAGGI